MLNIVVSIQFTLIRAYLDSNLTSILTRSQSDFPDGNNESEFSNPFHVGY